ncbi:hypothetical protein ABZ468_49965 [Streptomyces sp. NPDC005708]
MGSGPLATKLIDYARLRAYEPQPVGRQPSGAAILEGCGSFEVTVLIRL